MSDRRGQPGHHPQPPLDPLGTSSRASGSCDRQEGVVDADRGSADRVGVAVAAEPIEFSADDLESFT